MLQTLFFCPKNEFVKKRQQYEEFVCVNKEVNDNSTMALFL